MTNEIIEYLYRRHIINEEMRQQIYAYYMFCDQNS